MAAANSQKVLYIFISFFVCSPTHGEGFISDDLLTTLAVGVKAMHPALLGQASFCTDET